MLTKSIITLFGALIFSSVTTAQSSAIKYDTDAKVTFRPKEKPKFKNKPNGSGYCCTIFDISTAGIPQNIDTTYCTHEVLAEPIKQRIAKFRYDPAVINNEPVVRKDKTRRMGYVHTKGKRKRKRVIPGPNGYLTPKKPDATIPSAPKRIMGSKWLREHFNTGKPCIEYIS